MKNLWECFQYPGKPTEKHNFLCLENAVAGRQVVSEEIV